ncbi:2-amino-4-hydroxy-6-hydroxymethyldihydropteridine diphosphokinase [Cellulophaga fucicola]|uniref:2-amino-4-hydroxy-6- hydroxymethyldihydropteridine diphosphokinase n=1 Tax=Cellulophaga fucicola TaxID=76595 RepID=UPI003EB7CEF3
MKKNFTTAYLSIGSNLGDKITNLQDAIFLLAEKAGSIAGISKVYKSESWGFESEDFLNACVAIHTTNNAFELLDIILKIETELGRLRTNEEGYQARTIDIDIIYFGKEVINTDTLVLPHPNLQFRSFVLRPLADVAPQFYHPILNKDSRNLFQECKDKGKVERTERRLYANREDLFSKAQFLAIEGNIGAGKTTLANKISEDYNAKLVVERFADNPFLPKFYEDQVRYAFSLEMSFLADRYQQYSDDTSQLDLFKSFMVSDYDIFKSLIFAKVTLQQDEFKLYRKLFDLMYKEVKKPDVFVYLYQNTERLLANIKKRGRDYEQDIQTDYLEKINKGYLDFIKSYPQQNTFIIDVSDLDFVANEADYKYIIHQIQGYISRNL